MTREYLKGLGLADEVIDGIMSEHGKTVTAIKTDLKTATDNLKVANDKITSFGNVDEIKAEVAKYKTDYEKAVADHNTYIAEQEFNGKLQGALNAYNPKNLKALEGFIDTAKLRESKNFDADLKAMVDPLKTSDAYLFNDGTPNPQFTNPNQKQNTQAPNDTLSALRSAMGLKNEKEK